MLYSYKVVRIFNEVIDASLLNKLSSATKVRFVKISS
jgi:hypothetical protein